MLQDQDQDSSLENSMSGKHIVEDMAKIASKLTVTL